MAARLSGLFTTATSEDTWERSWWRGRLLLHTLSFAATAVALTAVGSASGRLSFHAGLIILAAVGHVVSNAPIERRFRLSVVIYPVVLLAAWSMRVDLLATFPGGSLLPFAKLLAIVLALSSFNMRSLRSLYDLLLLGLIAILLASEGALTHQFGLFLLMFGATALGFLAVAYPVGEALSLRWVPSGARLEIAVPVVGVVIMTLAVSVVAFLVFPQAKVSLDARPLPSRLDLTVGRPAPPTHLPSGDRAPWARFLPSHDRTDAPSSRPDATREQAASGSGGEGSVSSPASGREPSATSPPTAAAAPSPEGGTPAFFDPGRYVELGYQGDEGADVVMYVRSPLASYWRGQILDEYDGRGWKPLDGSSHFVLNRWGRLRFDDAPPWSGSVGNYVQTFFPRVVQPDAVFTGYSPAHTIITARATGFGVGEKVRSSVERLRSAESYRVVSAVPVLTPDLLRGDFADRSYLAEVSLPRVPSRVRELAAAVVEGAPTDYDKAARLERFLLTNYDYDLRVPPLSRSSDVVDAFLFERHSGYCAQFATTMAVMARLVGLPARVVTGYMPGSYSSLTGAHAVRLQDAHAWVEIRFRRYGWVPFDPTPRPDSPWALDVGFVATTKGLQQALRAGIGDLFGGGASAAAGTVTSAFGGGGQAALYGLPLVMTLALAVAALRALAKRRNRGRRAVAGYSVIPGAEREHVREAYVKALRALEKRGYPERLPHQSPVEYVETLDSSGHRVPEAFRQISGHATHAFYDPAPLDQTVLERLKAGLRALRDVPRLVLMPRSPDVRERR